MREEIITCKNYFKKYEAVSSMLKFGSRVVRKVDISICIPTFGRPDLLEECIKSCLKQKPNHLSIEIIVVDNNPEPDNGNLKLLQRLNRPEICYYQNLANIGQFGNWNRCIELAQGTWSSLLHDDDLLAPDCFSLWEKLLASPKLSPEIAYIKTAAINFTDLCGIENAKGIKDRIRKKYGTKFYLVSKFDLIIGGVPGIYGMPTAGTLIKREALVKIGGYNTEHYFPSEDVFLPVRLFNRGYKIAATIAPFGYYRLAVNLSMKKEIQIGWVRDYLEYRCQAKKLGKRYEIYSHYFEEAQLYFACRHILKQYVPSCTDMRYFEEVPEVNKIEVKKVRFTLYRMIQRTHNYMFYVRALF